MTDTQNEGASLIGVEDVQPERWPPLGLQVALAAHDLALEVIALRVRLANAIAAARRWKERAEDA